MAGSVRAASTCILRLFAGLAISAGLASCAIPVTSEAINAASSQPLPETSGFRYALVSPASSNITESAAELELVIRGYTVIPSYAANAALRANPPPPILMVECYNLGSYIVGYRARCIAVNLQTGERLYEGMGQAMGWAETDSIYSAVPIALAKLPRARENRGRILTLGEVPNALADAARTAGGSSGGGGSSPRAASPPPSGPRMSSGSGFIVTPAGHIVTNAHVVDGCKTISARVGSTAHPVKVEQADEDNDLALLTLPAGSYPSVRLRQPGTPRLGEKVTVIGFPLQDVLASSTNVTSGNVSALAGFRNDISLFQLTAPIQPGNSGGPVVDEQGAVVGVVVAKLSDREMARQGLVAQNVNFAIKGSVAALFLDTHGVAWKAAEARATPSSTAVAEEAATYTVRILCTM